MKRAILLALLFAVAVGITLPLLHSEAAREKDRRAAASRKKTKKSRAWWRRYYSRVRKQRAAQARKKVAVWKKATKQVRDNHTVAKSAKIAPRGETMMTTERGGVYADGDVTVNLPEGWSSRPVMVNGERKFMVFGPNGQPVGQATMSSAWARSQNDEDNGSGRNRSLGGIPLRELRRSVIDKMAAANGWVVGDGEQEVNGRRVFVVTAQTGTADGKATQNWSYYFTENDGRIYSLTTNAPVEYSDQLVNDSNQVLGSFRPKNK